MLKVRIAVAVATFVVPAMIMMLLFGLVLAAAIPLALLPGQTTPNLLPGSVPERIRQQVAFAGSRCPEVSPALIAAQLKHESDFRPDAVNSSTGASGIAQFMPATWANWGKDYDADGVADAGNPADAIGSEADYLCAIAAQMKGWLADGSVHGPLIDLTLAGYNAGPAAVRSAGGVPSIAETIDYVRSINATMATFTGPVGSSGGLVFAEAGSDSLSNKAIAAAQAELGKPYVFGSIGPDTWDCSSLMQHAWQAVGVEITRTTYSQVESPRLHQIPYQQRRPGDLIYFKMNGAGGPFDHVGMVFDEQRMIEAPRTGLSVRYQVYNDDYYRSRTPMIMRVVNG